MTSKDKRQRHKEGHRSRIEAARIAEVQARRRDRFLRLGVAVVVLVVVAAGVWLFTRDDGDAEATDEATTTTAPSDPSVTEPFEVPVELPPGPDGRTLEGPTECPAADGSEERVAVFAEAPPMCIDPAEALEAEIVTSAGTIVVALDGESAPQTVNNFVVLARYGFYDGIPFHRLVPDFVAQVGGSGAPGPDGLPDYGTTGPGYDAEDVEHPADGYAVGDVAMARSAEVSGSQFFIVTSEQGLPALDGAGNYPRFGRVTEGLEVAEAMSARGDAASGGSPLELFTIESITIRPAA